MSGLNSIVIYYGYGNGSFTYGDFYFIGFNVEPTCLAIGHFNNDTNIDIVTVDSITGNITLILRYDYGEFIYNSIYTTIRSFYTSFIGADDLNNDKRLDFAVANNPTGEISVSLELGNEFFYEPIITSLKNKFYIS